MPTHHRHRHQLFAVAAVIVALASEQQATGFARLDVALPKASAVPRQLALAFEQTGDRTADRFIARAHGFTLRLMPTGAAFSTDSGGYSRVFMQFAGGSAAKPRAVRPLPGVVNYLIG